MASVPTCCPPGSHGAAPRADQGSLRGENVRLSSSSGEFDMYVSRPGPGELVREGQCLIFLPDIFGVDSGRTKVICDTFAAQGYTVVLPDVQKYGGIPSPDTFSWKVMALPSLSSFMWNNSRSVFMPRLQQAVLPFVRNEFGATDIALLCFCWGCYPMTCLLEQQESDIRCAVGFHPSLLVSRFYWENRQKQLAAVQVPMLFLSGKNDPSDVMPNGLADKAMQKKPFAKDCKFKLYKDMVHGWVNRGDLEQPDIATAYKASLDDATEFLAKMMPVAEKE
ncbi:Carboxymethylenebutenolidase-like [Hondaea fermentalgiana]|uniref:Carboxymethylenebutenolidase-like n=1 Tax=Hondaea fermentalgiana TaxID=2315210 RepID=A0A2R5GMG0_9STRA|nr:Carboxymethylenebutenolidase-like [Hondaea fermentalgiana]|eukprot:GBG29491.1 Carboxymethylenebutenolidase-like [Hondaea fermentalgiana]